MTSQPQVFSCKPDIRIRALPANDGAMPIPVRRRVDELWNRAVRERGGTLVDGELFSLLGEAKASDAEISGRFTKYRFYLAQCMDPSLQETLQVFPLAVTGIVLTPAGLLIGRRADTVTQDRGMWELIPAGGIEPDCLLPDGWIDPRLQLTKELGEEAGICGLDRAAPRLRFWMVQGGVTDLVFTLELSMSAAQIGECFARLAAPEHTAIDFIPTQRIGAELQGGRLSPSTSALLRALQGYGFS
jgi:8-oxo-dGTP pyrophosphatase MutT (NUDIX family)